MACLAAAFAAYWFGCVENRFRLDAAAILVLGLLLRLALIPLPPSDDIHRFIWEGEILAHGFSPFALAPDHPSLAFLHDSNWAGINHASMPTLYPPLSQLVFFLLAKIGQSVLVFKIGFLVLDVLGFYALRALVRRRTGAFKEGDQALALYFLNPLLIFEVAGHGHFESLPALLNLVFLGALMARKAWAPAVLGLGALAKITSLALAPLLLYALGWKRALAWGAGIALAVGGSLWAVGAFSVLGQFAAAFHFNAAFPSLIDGLFPFLSAFARGCIGMGLFTAAGLGGLFFQRHASRESQALWFMGLLLLFSPTLHPWYLLWVLPFAALTRSRPWLLLTGTVLITYEVYGRLHVTGQWRENPWLRLPEFLPPMAVWLYLAVKRRSEATGPAEAPAAAPAPYSGPVF